MRTQEGPRMPRFGLELIAVFVGGALGTLARWLVGLPFATAHPNVGFGAMVACNLIGSFLLGLSPIIEKPLLRLGVGTGFCGGFTTLSAVVLAIAPASASFPAVDPMMGFGLLVLAVAGGLVASWAGSCFVPRPGERAAEARARAAAEEHAAACREAEA